MVVIEDLQTCDHKPCDVNLSDILHLWHCGINECRSLSDHPSTSSCEGKFSTPRLYCEWLVEFAGKWITQTYRLVSDQPGNHVSPGKNLFRLAMTFFRLLWSLSYCCVCSWNGNDKLAFWKVLLPLSMSLASIYRQRFLKIAHNLSSLLGGLWCSAFFATNFMQPTTSRNHYTFSLATGDCTMSTMVGNKSSVRMYWIRVVDFFLSEPSDFWDPSCNQRWP